MTPAKVLLSLAFLAIPLCILARDDPAPSIRKSELGRQSFLVGSLNISIAKFKANVVFGSPAELGRGHLDLKIENTSKEFATFNPQKVSFVDRNNNQVTIRDVRQHHDEYIPPVEVRIAPGARFREFYRLKGNVRLPARLFYDEKLLVTITD